MIRALLWDVDGTLAETERDGHLEAFNRAFAALSVPWRWDESLYGELLSVAGGRERLLHDMRGRPEAPATVTERERLAVALHRVKNEHYAQIVGSGEVPLRPGVLALFDDCTRAGVPMGIATTTSRSNVAALLGAQLGKDWAGRFGAIVCAEEAPVKKPDPSVYRLALAALGVAPAQAVAIEDAPAGVEATRRAGIAVIVTRSHYFPQPAPAGVLAGGPSLASGHGWQPVAGAPAGRITLAQILRWYERSGAARTARQGSCAH